tara:strand:+ start:654 stop:1202 length:549 start_codon:yes stop_codon:yes gene_type:complete
MSILKTNQITDLGGNELLTSNGSGVISSGGAITNTPSFFAWRTSQQTTTADTAVKVNFDSEIYDTDNAFDTSLSRFTVPTGKSGKYLLYTQTNSGTNNIADKYIFHTVYKNGSEYDATGSTTRLRNLQTIVVNGRVLCLTTTGVVEATEGDYWEIYFYSQSNTVTLENSYGLFFGMQRLIGA